jgi:group I intron endonuclease
MKPSHTLKGRSGIYAIVNTIDGKMYIGKSVDLLRRCKQYILTFKREVRHDVNEYLWGAVKKHGVENFEFVAIDFCDPNELSSRELVWMITHGTTDESLGYNLRMDSESGMTAAHVTKLKMQVNLRKQWADGVRSGHSEKMVESWKRREGSREAQALVMKRNLTKWNYLFKGVTVPYEGLKEFGLQSAVGKFARYKTNVVVYKGVFIKRIRIENV